MTTNLVKFDTTHGAVELTVAAIKEQFCPKATDREAEMFLHLCRYQGLNPFLREAYLIKYKDDTPASMVVGKDVYMQRAEAHPQYDGFEAGLIARFEDGRETNVEGSRIPSVTTSHDGAKITLVGGWARVFRRDRRHSVYNEVELADFDTGFSLWKRMPGVMIRKVALVQSLRESFPHSFVGLYDSSEMGQELPDLPVVAESIAAPSVSRSGNTGGPKATREQIAELTALRKQIDWTPAQLREFAQQTLSIRDSSTMTVDEADALVAAMEALRDVEDADVEAGKEQVQRMSLPYGPGKDEVAQDV